MLDRLPRQTSYYDASRVIFTYGHLLPYQFASGPFFEAEYTENLVDIEMGCEGEPIQLDQLSLPGHISLTLMASDPFNIMLSAHVAADALFARGTLPIAMRDANGGDLVFSTRARIVKMPRMRKAQQPSPVEWRWFCEPLVIHHGGLPPADRIGASSIASITPDPLAVLFRLPS